MTALLRRAALACALALPAAAQDGPLPALFAVTGVDAGDTLNVRAAPDPSAPVLFDLAAGATGVEIVRVEQDGAGRPWGLVGAPEAAGWTAMRFLARTTPADLPWLSEMRCSGTEPFWSFALDRTDDALYEGMEGDADAVLLSSRTRSRNAPASYGFTGEGAFGPASGIVTRQACSDGMSERAYGLSLELLMSTPGGTDHVTGCCRLAP